MVKLVANLSMLFTESPLHERFALAAKAGFKAVEVWFPYEYPVDVIAHELNTHDLTLMGINTPAGEIAHGEWGLSALPGREEEARKAIDLALSYARSLNCPAVHVMAGVTHGLDKSQCANTFIDNVRYAANQAKKYGITILLEGLAPATRPGYLFSSQYHALEYIQKVGRDNVLLQFDVFHAQQVDGNLTHLIHELKEYIGHVQIASVPERHEPIDGEVDYTWIFSTLEKINYTGYVAAEYNPRGETVTGLEWARQWLNK
ncbi:2-oxo-tetronate isomerase [Scandinavium manionii]|uniref:2-oxo-tetronate isomerase n=1 Tax=Scandinavium manionii TaxID=2926520 RepID=UPI0013577BBA|nr:2-oxo-tetronate isomerase [Scandinavium manionii]MCS2149972.1 TIM barrel protein [Scandinavium manionii]MCS2168340.1 TIM barrel protein [Scandinavium manionii]